MIKRSRGLIDQLVILRGQYDRRSVGRLENVLNRLQGFRPADAEQLVRVHDAVLFLRAFPPSRAIAALADRWLSGAGGHVERLKAAGADLSLFDDERFSGMAGTALRDTFTYEVSRWLVTRHGDQVHAD